MLHLSQVEVERCKGLTRNIYRKLENLERKVCKAIIFTDEIQLFLWPNCIYLDEIEETITEKNIFQDDLEATETTEDINLDPHDIDDEDEVDRSSDKLDKFMRRKIDKIMQNLENDRNIQELSSNKEPSVASFDKKSEEKTNKVW